MRCWVITWLIVLATYLTALYSSQFLYSLNTAEEVYSWVSFYNHRKTLVVSTRILGVGAIIGGFLIQEFVLELNVFVRITRTVKLYIPERVFFGAVVRFLVFSGLRKNVGRKLLGRGKIKRLFAKHIFDYLRFITRM